MGPLLIENSQNFSSQQLLCLDLPCLFTAPSKLKLHRIRRQYSVACFFEVDTIFSLYLYSEHLGFLHTARIHDNQVWCKPQNDSTHNNQGTKEGEVFEPNLLALQRWKVIQKQNLLERPQSPIAQLWNMSKLTAGSISCIFSF